MTMDVLNLEDKMQQAGGALRMLRTARSGPHIFAFTPEVSNWRDEQRAWMTTAVLYDQSFHMTEASFRGPDVRRLFSDVATNDFRSFGRNRAKQVIVARDDGYFVGDAILFGMDDDDWMLVGAPASAHWLQYHGEQGGYDVEVSWDEMIPFNPTGRRRQFRFEVQGPAALEVVRAAAGGELPEIKFFGIGEFQIAGAPVRALNHTMSGLPGQEKTGLEIFGLAEYGPQVKEALLSAGAPLGLIEGGSISYPTAAIESGWLATPVPAVYDRDDLRPYRQWLDIRTFESNLSLGGSFVADDIRDYYVTPWEMGYGRSISFEHDFIARDALQRARDEQSRRKVYLTWDDDDVVDVFRASLFDTTGTPAKYLNVPTAVYAGTLYDTVAVDGVGVGFSSWVNYSVNVGSFASLAILDEGSAYDGARVEITWGEPNGGSGRPAVERHRQVPVRATVSLESPVKPTPR